MTDIATSATVAAAVGMAAACAIGFAVGLLTCIRTHRALKRAVLDASAPPDWNAMRCNITSRTRGGDAVKLAALEGVEEERRAWGRMRAMESIERIAVATGDISGPLEDEFEELRDESAAALTRALEQTDQLLGKS